MSSYYRCMFLSKISLCALAAWLTLAGLGRAAILTNYSFTAASAGSTGPFAADTSAANVTNSNLTYNTTGSPGVVTAFANATDASAPAYTFDGKGFEISADQMVNSTTTPVPANYFLAFNIAPTAGNALQLTSLTADFGYDINVAAAGTVFNYDLFYSLDNTNFFQVGSTSTATGADNRHAIVNDLNKSFASIPALTGDLTSPVYFQLRFQDNNSGVSTKRFFIDDITLNGSVSAIPEPSTLLLSLGGLAGFVFLRRRAI